MDRVRHLLQAVLPAPKPALVPDGVRVFAIGDIHGRFDLLQGLHDMIVDDLARSLPDRSIGVFLGDYVDRGPQSREVLEWLSAGVKAFDETVILKGNHDLALEEFLADPSLLAYSIQLGGLHTIRSYGVEFELTGEPGEAEETHGRFVTAFPDRHRQLLSGLRFHHTIGDYFFVHAGVRPGVPLDRQEIDDMIWIREPFLNSRRDFGKVVVHGHTIVAAPDERRNRINIDTGAFTSGVLTCLVLEGPERRFLQAG